MPKKLLDTASLPTLVQERLITLGALHPYPAPSAAHHRCRVVRVHLISQATLR
jgi:hypothetical protein